MEKLPAAEREKKLLEGAKKEGEMVWYTNSGIENATRYIQAFQEKISIHQRQILALKDAPGDPTIVAEANAGKHLVDVIKPSTDLLPMLLESNLIGKYDTPLRAIYPAHAKSPFYTNMNYAFRVFAFNPRKVNAKDAPKSWDDLLQPKWKNEILFDESSLEEVMAMLAAWGKERTVNYLNKLTQQNLLIRVGRDTTTQMMMAGEAQPRGDDLRLQQRRAARAERAGRLGRGRSDPSLDLSAHFGAQCASSLCRCAFLRLFDLRRRPAPDRQRRPRRLPSESRADLSAHERAAKSARHAAHPAQHLEQNAKLLKDGVKILDEVVLKRKSSGH